VASNHGAREAHGPVPLILFALTFVTGLLDAVTYLGLGHVFAANQTGNVIVLGFALVGAGQISVTASLASFAAFVVGAAFSGWTTPRLERAIHRWTRVMFVLEAGLLVVAAVLSAVSPVLATPVVAILAFAMGMRNVTLQHLGLGTVSTTVLTTTLASLAGSGLMRRNWEVARPRLGAVVAMLLGAVCGALLLQYGTLAVLGLAAALTVAVAFVYGTRAVRTSSQTFRGETAIIQVTGDSPLR
jgi:uncharacterized membrane protein YoaK (UPF0700 family)